MRHEIYGDNGKTLLRVEEIKESAAEILREQIAADFAAQPIGVGLALRDLQSAIVAFLSSNQPAKAREVLETWPLPPALESFRKLLRSRL